MNVVELFPEFGIENLRVTERPEPAPGPGEVKIRVRAISLNYRDLAIVKGINLPNLELPRIPCSDGAGEVVAVGPGVTRVKTGDRVMGLFMPDWIDGQVTPAIAAGAQGGLVDGMAAEYRVLPERAVLPMPSHLSFEEAATLPCAGLTAWNSLFENRPLQSGQSVLMRGTGGVAIFSLLFAKALGCRLLATSSEAEKRDRLLHLGASAVCDYKEHDWVAWAQKETSGAGVDVIVDSVGGASLNDSLKAVRMGGYIALMGVLEGLEGNITTGLILRKHIHLQGIFVGSRAMFGRMNAFIARHALRPVISHTFAVEEIQAAFRCMEERQHFGKIVVRL